MEDRAVRIFEGWEPPEGYRAELLRGEVLLTPGPDIVHNLLVASVRDQVPYARWHRLHTQDVSIPSDGSEPQPDLVVFERGSVEENGRLLAAADVTLVVEVVSKTSIDRDYRTKRYLYAEGTIPAYLIVDPIKGVCVLLTEPTADAPGGTPDYLAKRIGKFGDSMPVDVLDLTLDTSEFQTYS